MISVIVPVYNVENYLSRCIDSILAQTYQNYELVLVDDGSTDESGIICDRYALQDKRIAVIHKENGGVSDARNYGLDHASGEYICFVDSDDYVGPDYLNAMIELIIEYHADLAIVSSTIVFGDKVEEYVESNETHVMSGKEAFHHMLVGDWFGCSPWGKLYKKSIFNGVKFPKGYIFDDFYTIPYIFEKYSVCVYSESVHYYYFQRSQSLTHLMSTERVEMREIGTEKLLRYTSERFPEYNLEAETLAISGLFNDCIDPMLNSSEYPAIAHEIRSRFKETLQTAWSNQRIGRKRKLGSVIFLKSPRLYRLLKKVRLKTNRDPVYRRHNKLMEIE